MSPLRLPTALLLLAGALASSPVAARAQSAASPEMASNPNGAPSAAVSLSKRIQPDFSKLGGTVASDAMLTDDGGKSVRFGDLLGKRPVLLMPLFYNCQTACPQETDNLLKVLIKEEGENALRKLGAQAAGIDVNQLRRERRLLVGRDFDVVFLSIHPLEKPEDAHRRRVLVEDNFSEGWKKLGAEEKRRSIESVQNGFHYLVGRPDEVRKVTDAIGFRFFYNSEKNQMNHPAMSAMLSSSGKIVGYISGPDYATKVLANEVDLASRNEVGPLGDTMLFGCIMVDPMGKYTILYSRVLFIGCVLTMLTLGGSIFLMSRKSSRPAAPSTFSPGGTAGGDGAA